MKQAGTILAYVIIGWTALIAIAVAGAIVASLAIHYWGAV